MNPEQKLENPQVERFVRGEVKLYYDIFVPETASKPAPLLVSVHGYGAHKRYMLREGKLIAPENFAVAAPQALHQHIREFETAKEMKVGFSWATNYKAEESIALHHKFLREMIETLIDEGVADQEKIFLLGFSQSCALNFRLAFTFPELFRGVIGICGGIPGDWETSKLFKPSNAEILYLYGDNDQFYPLAHFEKCAERLKTRTSNVTAKGYSAKHEITDEMRRDIRRWLQERV